MGFWHTDSPTDLMYGTSGTCDVQPSARERAAAAIAYSRPAGNMDPDTDPWGLVSIEPMRLVQTFRSGRAACWAARAAVVRPEGPRYERPRVILKP